jgi:hypothetical protein
MTAISQKSRQTRTPGVESRDSHNLPGSPPLANFVPGGDCPVSPSP